jgi:hypothetical protein
MKTTTALATTLLACFGLFAQGTYNLDNSPLSTQGTVDARIFDYNGTTPLAGTNFFAQLFIGTVSNAASLIPQGVIARFYPFGNGAGGYLNPSGTTIRATNIAPGALGFVQLRAWTGAATYLEAVNTPGARIGMSSILNLVAGGFGAPPSLPANLVGLQSFSLVGPLYQPPDQFGNTPEPSTLVLGILGGIVLLSKRYKIS